MCDQQKKNSERMDTHAVSNTIKITRAELLSGITLELSIPDGIQPINLQERKFTSEDLSIRSKRLADRYVRLLEESFNPDEDFMKDPEAFTIYLSLLGLSCELYIKSLLYREQKSDTVSWKSGHNLSVFFEKLTKNMQLKLQNDFAGYFPELNFQEELKKIDLFFRKFRYAYELDGYSVNLCVAQVILGILKSL